MQTPGTALLEASLILPAENLSVPSLTPQYLVRSENIKALNCIIFSSESKNLPGRPPLEISLAHSAHLLKLMSNSELGACAFADIQSILN